MLALVDDDLNVIEEFREGAWFTWPGGCPTQPAEASWPGADGFRLLTIHPAERPPAGKRRVVGSRRIDIHDGSLHESFDLEEDYQSYSRAVQAHLDATARFHDYQDIASAVSYAASGVPRWAAEGVAFRIWRDGAWIKCLTEVERIRAGERAAPTIQELLEELPPLTFPAA